MTSEELLKQVRKLEIRTKGLTRHLFSGEYHSSFKGRGMTFREVREYHPGDEVRTIDWNVTARFNAPFVKLFEEEREMTVMLIIDFSGSSYFGTQSKTKKHLAVELAAVLAWSAEMNHDKVGAIFVSDRLEKYIAPEKGRKHVQYLLRELIEFEPQGKGTDLSEGLRYFRNTLKKRSIGFLISDFVSEQSLQESLRITARKHDLVALRLFDPADAILPDLGLIEVYQAESDQKVWINTSSEKVQKDYSQRYADFERAINDNFKRAGIDHAVIQTDSDFIPPLIHLFQNRK